MKDLTSPTLEKFESEEEFLDYLRSVKALARKRGIWWANLHAPQYAQAGGGKQEIPCPEGVKPPCYSDKVEKVTVTGTRVVAKPAASITNVQMRGVDEGDIVKQFSHFLVVLQDGRLFTVDTRPRGQVGLALVDRANVYRSNKESTWYDEMLIYDNRIVVTGYSYGRSAAEFSIFTIDDSGRLTREATYYISSDDYYSGNNYATRLVDDRLVIQTTLHLPDLEWKGRFKWPLIRRWQREGDDDSALTPGKRVFDARDIYRPVQATLEPAIRTVSVCPLGTRRAGDELECRTTAFIAAAGAVYFVSRDDVYLWSTPGWEERIGIDKGPVCEPNAAAAFENGVPGALFKVSLDNGAVRFMEVRGDPVDQFSLDVDTKEFRALAAWNASCEDRALEVKYFRKPLTGFSTASGPALAQDYLDLPAPNAQALENRFTDRALVYGGRKSWSSYPPYSQEDNEPSARVVAVPLAAPQAPVVLEAPHNIIRIESVGHAAVLTGYKDNKGLSISLVDLRGAPRAASTVTLAGRFESEGRSHAYNAAIEPDGSGIMGVPTVKRTYEAGRWVWRSQSSDVSFLSLRAQGQLDPIGELEARQGAQHPSYTCEVSCVDWYGNTRPIFTDNRIFALAATELVEGRLQDGRIQELRRVNLTMPLTK